MLDGRHTRKVNSSATTSRTSFYKANSSKSDFDHLFVGGPLAYDQIIHYVNYDAYSTGNYGYVTLDGTFGEGLFDWTDFSKKVSTTHSIYIEYQVPMSLYNYWQTALTGTASNLFNSWTSTSRRTFTHNAAGASTDTGYECWFYWDCYANYNEAFMSHKMSYTYWTGKAPYPGIPLSAFSAIQYATATKQYEGYTHSLKAWGSKARYTEALTTSWTASTSAYGRYYSSTTGTQTVTYSTKYGP